MDKKASILLPTYNTGKYITEMLESIRLQSYINIQLIIIDDCSTDGTYERIKHWEENTVFETGLQIKLIKNQRNLGLTETINKAYQFCNGDFIFISDHDDIWFPEKVKEQIEKLNRSPNAIICFHDREIINGKNEILCKSEYNYLSFNKGTANLNDALQGNIKYSANTMCFKNTPEMERIFPIPSNIIRHDFYLMICASIVGNIVYIRHPLIKYRIHENNQSANYSLEMAKNYRFYKKIRRQIELKSSQADKNDSPIICKQIMKLFGKRIKICTNRSNSIKNTLISGFPFIHYLYIKMIAKRKFYSS